MAFIEFIIPPVSFPSQHHRYDHNVGSLSSPCVPMSQANTRNYIEDHGRNVFTGGHDYSAD